MAIAALEVAVLAEQAGAVQAVRVWVRAALEVAVVAEQAGVESPAQGV